MSGIAQQESDSPPLAMLSSLVVLLLSIVAHAAPSPSVRQAEGACTNSTTGTLRYLDISTPDGPDWGTTIVINPDFYDGNQIEVDTTNTDPADGDIYIFQICSSSYMGYTNSPSNPDNTAYGQIIEKSTGRCLFLSEDQPWPPYLATCAFDDDTSLNDRWVARTDLFHSNTIFFVADQEYMTEEYMGLQLGLHDTPTPPPSNPPPAIFEVGVESVETPQYIFYLNPV